MMNSGPEEFNWSYQAHVCRGYLKSPWRRAWDLCSFSLWCRCGWCPDTPRSQPSWASELRRQVGVKSLQRVKSELWGNLQTVNSLSKNLGISFRGEPKLRIMHVQPFFTLSNLSHLFVVVVSEVQTVFWSCFSLWSVDVSWIYEETDHWVLQTWFPFVDGQTTNYPLQNGCEHLDNY